MGSQSQAVGSVLTFEGARSAFEILVRKWEVQEQLGLSTSSIPELLKEYQQDGDEDMINEVEVTVTHITERLNKLGPYLREMEVPYPEKCDIGRRIILEKIQSRNPPEYPPDSPIGMIQEDLQGYSGPMLKRLWNHVVRYHGNHPFWSRGDEGEDEEKNCPTIEEPEPPDKIPVIISDISQIINTSGCLEEYEGGLSNLLEVCGVTKSTSKRGRPRKTSRASKSADKAPDPAETVTKRRRRN